MEHYQQEKLKFYKKHGAVLKEESQLVNGTTAKTVLFEDRAIWCEVYGKYAEEATVTVRGIKVKVTVDLFRIEYWSTDNSISQFAYERY